MRNKAILTIALILALTGLAAASGAIGRIERWLRRDSAIDIVYSVTVSGEAIVRWLDGDVRLHQETIGSKDAAPVRKQWRIQVPPHNNLAALSVTPTSADSWGTCNTLVDDPEGSYGADEHTVHGNQASATCTSMTSWGGAATSDDDSARLLASATTDGAEVVMSTSSGDGYSGTLELGHLPLDPARPEWPVQSTAHPYGRLSIVVISSVPDNTLKCSIEVDGKSVADAQASAVGELAVCTYQMP